ncbi:hypothetical protein [Tenacibaculum maritimum]|uniref:hypothetical protein n=1 Tax=Tenacibaculum maritimum TaxID=107401 RepID=UPI000401A0E9|nr:hypothetical protein [Tenacibaculum maritimum]MDB0599820.1 hypothetical protein [Tenacibaculum maritimum]MDB0610930.1 hypothetical protein [Tenacibaculum maritimum]CAA0245373.1 hypothetical protein TFA04_650001 [Tenacibaculum maritimum]CAA0259890.1 hypothetical protein TMFC_90006 [Tenacibaculum maritimum]
MITNITEQQMQSHQDNWKENKELPPHGSFLAKTRKKKYLTLKHLIGSDPEFKKWSFLGTAKGYLKLR